MDSPDGRGNPRTGALVPRGRSQAGGIRDTGQALGGTGLTRIHLLGGSILASSYPADAASSAAVAAACNHMGWCTAGGSAVPAAVVANDEGKPLSSRMARTLALSTASMALAEYQFHSSVAAPDDALGCVAPWLLRPRHEGSAVPTSRPQAGEGGAEGKEWSE